MTDDNVSLSDGGETLHEEGTVKFYQILMQMQGSRLTCVTDNRDWRMIIETMHLYHDLLLVLDVQKKTGDIPVRWMINPRHVQYVEIDHATELGAKVHPVLENAFTTLIKTHPSALPGND